ncbi:MAG: hypothetical protein ACOYNL_09395 [Rickettsiales bacterium]
MPQPLIPLKNCDAEADKQAQKHNPRVENFATGGALGALTGLTASFWTGNLLLTFVSTTAASTIGGRLHNDNVKGHIADAVRESCKEFNQSIMDATNASAESSGALAAPQFRKVESAAPSHQK